MTKYIATYKILFQIIIWIAFITMPLYTLPNPLELINTNLIYLITYLITTFISIVFFYLNYYWAIPKLFYKNKKAQYLLSLLVFTTLIISTLYILNYFIISKFEQLPPQGNLLIRGMIFKFVIVFIISWILYLSKRNKENETKKDIAELAYLKTQINPHFLFNTLNGLYGLAITKSEKTAESILQLSEIMRYILTDAKGKQVTLEKEIAYIQNYIELQKIRLTPKTKILFELKGQIANKAIEPLLLIAYIENAFKYGVSTEIESEINIKISIEGKNLVLETKNNKVSTYFESNKIGLVNTQKRLDIAYPNNYKLQILDEKDYYYVNLKLHLK